MNSVIRYCGQALAAFYVLFAFSSSFSIALAQSALGISLILFISLAIVQRYNPITTKLKWFYLAVGSYIVWQFAAALFGSTPLESFFIIKEEWLFAAIPVGLYVFRDSRHRKWVMMGLTIGLLVASSYGLIQHFTGLNLFRPDELPSAPDFGYRASGAFSHRLTFGNYVGLASVFLLASAIGSGSLRAKSLSLFTLLVAVLGILATILSYSRGPILAMAVALIISGILLERRFYRYSLPLIVLAGLTIIIFVPGLTYGFKDRMASDLGGEYEGGRMFIWKNSVGVIGENPFLGVGQGNFKEAYSRMIGPDLPEIRQHTHAHNDLLNVAAISGITGALFYLSIWLAVTGYLYRSWRSGNHSATGRGIIAGAFLASVFFFVSSMSEAIFADEEVRQLLMLIWAIGLSAVLVEREPLDLSGSKNT